MRRESERESLSANTGHEKCMGGCGVSLLERKLAEKEHRQGFLNSAALAVCTPTHPAGPRLSCTTAHFISPARLAAGCTSHAPSLAFAVPPV